MEKKENIIQSFSDTFVSKLKEQSFTILIIQRTPFNLRLQYKGFSKTDIAQSFDDLANIGL